MNQRFADMLSTGGHANSLGRVADVIEAVLQDKSRLGELYDCLFAQDAWVRMRAADTLEKVCREHPDWPLPYIGRIQKELAGSTQASILWHIAQIYAQVELTATQKALAIQWLKRQITTTEVDWIVAANVMDTLAQFVRDGSVSRQDFAALLKVQQLHKSKSVVRRASKWLESYGLRNGRI